MGKKISKQTKTKTIKSKNAKPESADFVSGRKSPVKIVIWVVVGIVAVEVLGSIMFYGNHILGRWDAEKTINDPMISKDLLGMELDRSIMIGVGGYSGPRYNPSITNYFNLPEGVNRCEVFNQLAAEVEKNDWSEIEKLEDEFDDFGIRAKKSKGKYDFELVIRITSERVELKITRIDP